jgi:hypothetical protein
MNDIKPGKVGEISEAVINTLGLSVLPGTPVYIGQSNITHMLQKHVAEYVKYGSYIHDIVSFPDYVGLNPGDGSVEFVKEFPVNNDFVKVAVRVSKSGIFFARSIYILNPNRVNNFIASGTLKALTKT